MSGEDDGADRPHEATQRKLDEARKRGELPRTADLTAAAAAAGLLALALLPGGWLAPQIGGLGLSLLDRAEQAGPALLDGGGGFFTALMGGVARAMAPVAILPAAAVIATLFALKGLVFAPQKLAPKLSRISPLSTAKQKFGPSGLVEFAKSTVKLALYAGILWIFLAAHLDRIMATLGNSPALIGAEMLRMMAEFALLVLVVMLVIGGLDHLWQVFDHRRRQMMSHQELREEHKEAEGDPHLKQQRRQRAMAIATSQMIAEVPRAAVVIVNPTHYAVALKWTPGSAGAPVCVAKGVDEVAARIREAAREAGVPIHSDPPTARALHATVKLGQEVAPEHYAPVAAAIRFADEMRRRARGRH
ncbi:MAG: flagellar biosynthesis protein FlhB [Rhodobacter sp.]|nr:flagellar biosynthesis protein FlhB [Paracoccaceae bacterium]MCC0075021.1 flagellar biosynthesis protein FlhB [Rhodobacter sp.]